jgi:hypothetical protein
LNLIAGVNFVPGEILRGEFEPGFFVWDENLMNCRFASGVFHVKVSGQKNRRNPFLSSGDLVMKCCFGYT